MAASPGDRVKASKLRAKVAAGKALSAEQAAWLDRYDAAAVGHTIRAAKALPRAPVDTRGPVRGPQLEIAGASSSRHASVQETVPPPGVLSPDEFTWSPTVPPASAGAEPPPPGAPPPAEPGTFVAGARASAGDEGPAQVGDPAVAKAMGTLAGMVAGFGLLAMGELAVDLPAELRQAWAQLPELQRLGPAIVQLVQGAAERLALKHGMTETPVPDELIVGGALLGTIAAWVRVAKQRAASPAARRAPEAAPTTTAPSPPPRAEPKAPSPIDALFTGGVA